MAIIIICSDFGVQENKICHYFHFAISMSHEVMGLDAMILFFFFFFECSFLSQLFHSPLSPSLRGSLVPLSFLPLGWYHLHIWSYWYFSWQPGFQPELRPAWHFIWCKLNKQGDNIQPWCTPFPIWNQSIVPCQVQTVAFGPTYRFHKRQVRWSGIPVSTNFPQFVVIHTVKGFGVVNKAELDLHSYEL